MGADAPDLTALAARLRRWRDEGVLAQLIERIFLTPAESVAPEHIVCFVHVTL